MTSSLPNEAPVPKARFRWYRRPEYVGLLAGAIGWFASQGWDYWKDTKSEAAEQVAEVRAAITQYLVPRPQTYARALEVIAALEAMLSLHTGTAAQDYLQSQLSYMRVIADTLRADEISAAALAAATAKAAEELKKAELAKRAASDAVERDKQALDAAAKAQAEQAAQAVAAQQEAERRRASEAARAQRMQDFIDRHGLK